VPKLQAYEKGADEYPLASVDKIGAAMGRKVPISATSPSEAI